MSEWYFSKLFDMINILIDENKVVTVNGPANVFLLTL